MVLTNCDKPSNAKNSDCSGTSTVLDPTKAIIVKRLNDGGQSTNI